MVHAVAFCAEHCRCECRVFDAIRGGATVGTCMKSRQRFGGHVRVPNEVDLSSRRERLDRVKHSRMYSNPAKALRAFLQMYSLFYKIYVRCVHFRPNIGLLLGCGGTSILAADFHMLIRFELVRPLIKSARQAPSSNARQRVRRSWHLLREYRRKADRQDGPSLRGIASTAQGLAGSARP